MKRFLQTEEARCDVSGGLSSAILRSENTHRTLGQPGKATTMEASGGLSLVFIDKVEVELEVGGSSPSLTPRV